jgi:hypothetical protein
LGSHRQNASDLWSSFAWYNQQGIAMAMNHENWDEGFPALNEEASCMAMVAATGSWENTPCNTTDVFTVCEIIR